MKKVFIYNYICYFFISFRRFFDIVILKIYAFFGFIFCNRFVLILNVIRLEQTVLLICILLLLRKPIFLLVIFLGKLDFFYFLFNQCNSFTFFILLFFKYFDLVFVWITDFRTLYFFWIILDFEFIFTPFDIILFFKSLCFFSLMMFTGKNVFWLILIITKFKCIFTKLIVNRN